MVGKNITDLKKSSEFVFYFDMGLQYYIAGRFAYLNQFITVGPVLFHHALELFMKGSLLGQFSEIVLKRSFSHDLERLWREFKKVYNLQDTEYDETVKCLNTWEELRYPKNYNHVMMLRIKKVIGPLQAANMNNNEYEFSLSLEEIDKLVKLIFRITSVSTNFIGFGMVLSTDDSKKYYRKFNEHQVRRGKTGT